MNAALIHDKLFIKSFWEKRINNHCQHDESEDQRMEKSALNRLRDEWFVRLETRNKHLKSHEDNYVRKVKTEMAADQTEDPADSVEDGL